MLKLTSRNRPMLLEVKIMSLEPFFGCWGLHRWVFGVVRTYGKSPCFSALAFLWWGQPDWMVSKLMVVDGACMR